MNTELLKHFWQEYKVYFKLPLQKHKEKYKWQVLKQVYSKWNWSEADKKKMFKEAFEVSGLKNLWNSGNFYPVSHTNWMFHLFPEETTSAFNTLFDESIDLESRIQQFIRLYDEKLPFMNDLIPEKEIRNHYHGDRRAIALYLSLQFPDKYFLYKFSMNKEFCRKIEDQIPVMGRKENVFKYFTLAENVLNFIKEDIEFIEEYRKFATNVNYSDDSLHLLTQDFIYSTASYFKYIAPTTNININANTMISSPINQILYGPPGTGKTYSTIDKVIDIIHPQTRLNRSDKKKEFDQLIQDGRVHFTTFHQSMSYEEFIEGIKPITIDGQVHYEITDGIFKSICEQCLDEIKEIISQKNLENETIALTFKEKYNEFVKAIKLKIVQIKTRSGLIATISKISVAGNMRLTTGMDTRDYIISANRLEKLVEKFPNPEEIKNIHEEIRSVIGGSHTSLYYAALEAFVKFEKNLENTIKEEGKEIELNDIVLSENDIQSLPPYFIIIDEINRGNVSAIFGELITLIESDKRFGKDNQLFAKLAYSKENFIVPPNLYIIGTMNTADRSVEALDTALRRRFSFEEMVPKPELISPSAMICRLFWKYKSLEWNEEPYKEKEEELFELLGIDLDFEETKKSIWKQMKEDNLHDKLDYFENESSKFSGIDLSEIIIKINERIEVLLDKDHKIGHAYFMNVNSIRDLKEVFRLNIIPLLQEYFFGNYEKIKLILGNDFVREISSNNIKFASQNHNETLENIMYIEVPESDQLFIEAIEKML